MYVNGCMPRPEALIEGFVQLQNNIRHSTKKPGYKKYQDEYEFYQTNQEKLFGKNKEPKYLEDFAGNL